MRTLNWIVGTAVVALVAAAIIYMPESADGPCAARDFEGSRFTVCEFRAAVHEATLVWADGQGAALRSFDALAASGAVDPKRVRFAMNAGMFDETGAPIGLFVAKGREEHAINQVVNGEGNFHMQPNGVFFIDENDQVRILTTADYVQSGVQPNVATQSGPMLVIGKTLNPNFSADGSSRYVRNGVGVRSSAGAYFVISEDVVSFGKFARFFRDVLGCEDALYLDGGVSSLWTPASGRRDAGAALGPMIAISDRAKLRN